MEKFRYLTIVELLKLLKSKEVTSVDITEYYLDRIKNSKSNAFITVCEDDALRMAKESDTRIASNNARALEGVPLGIKDLFCTRGVKTTSASKMLFNYIPQYESTVTERFWNKGAVMLGKLNMDEFAMGSTNQNSYFGDVLSPWKVDGKHLVPGGSSGGSSSSVSGDLCIAATGSDTGGSVRQPAAFTGVVGFKPSYGSCSRYGMIAYSSSLDQAGFLTRTVQDAALLYDSVVGLDEKDSTLCSASNKDISSTLFREDFKPAIGIVKEVENIDVDPEISAVLDESIRMLKDAGCRIIEHSMPTFEYAIQVYYFVSMAEASSNLARYDGIKYGFSVDDAKHSVQELIRANRCEGFGDEVKRRILVGTAAILKESYRENYEMVLKIRRLIYGEYQMAFGASSAILLPTTPNLPFGLDEEQSSLSKYNNDIFTVSVNITGLPAFSIPTKLSSAGKPIGMQLVGSRFEDAELASVAHLLEGLWGFNEKYKDSIMNNIK